MTHEFKIGDTVRLNGTYHRGKIIGFSPKDKNLVLCDWFDGGQTPASIEFLTLIVPANETQLNHPSKIET